MEPIKVPQLTKGQYPLGEETLCSRLLPHEASVSIYLEPMVSMSLL